MVSSLLIVVLLIAAIAGLALILLTADSLLLADTKRAWMSTVPSELFVLDFLVAGHALMACLGYVFYEPYPAYFIWVLATGLLWALIAWHGMMSVIGVAVAAIILVIALAIRLVRGDKLVARQAQRPGAYILVAAIATPPIALLGLAIHGQFFP